MFSYPAKPVLVLEGGGMRGVYTSGVLEALAESKRIRFAKIVACSAGACAAASYLAGQPERNRRVYLDFLDGDKLIRFRRLLRGGSIMDIDYLALDVTLRLCPLDIDALRASGTRLHIGVTDWNTGRARYLTSHEDDIVTALRATCALPFFYRGEVVYQGRRYVDGGVSDPVPMRKALSLGARELVVVLTSSIERRAQERLAPGLAFLFSSSSAVRRALRERHHRYREAAELTRSPPRGVRIRVIRPSRPLPVTRTTTDRRLLEQGCDLGYEDGRRFVQQVFDSEQRDQRSFIRTEESSSGRKLSET
ncbi:MAG TPA: patatin family protein [Vicinamibacteria bacterium]|nr:patatin family protein [Vicinamibacteria bacterium]